MLTPCSDWTMQQFRWCRSDPSIFAMLKNFLRWFSSSWKSDAEECAQRKSSVERQMMIFPFSLFQTQQPWLVGILTKSMRQRTLSKTVWQFLPAALSPCMPLQAWRMQPVLLTLNLTFGKNCLNQSMQKSGTAIDLLFWTSKGVLNVFCLIDTNTMFWLDNAMI